MMMVISLLTYSQILFYANAGVTKEGSLEGGHGGYVSLYLSCEVSLNIKFGLGARIHR